MADIEFTSTGGMIAGGSDSFVSGQIVTSSGGCVAGGSDAFVKNKVITSTGGCICGGKWTTNGKYLLGAMVRPTGGEIAGGEGMYFIPSGRASISIPGAVSVVGFSSRPFNYGHITLPGIQIYGHNGAYGGIELPGLVQIYGVGTVTTVANASLTLGAIQIAGKGRPTTSGIGVFSIPFLTISGSGRIEPTCSGDLSIPFLAIYATAHNELNYSTIVQNLRNKAISEYEHFNFESYAEFPAGSFIAATSDGLYSLYSSSDTDNGKFINWDLELGTTDFGMDVKKNCHDGFIVYRGEGETQILALVDEKENPSSGEEDPYVSHVEGIPDGRLRTYKFKLSRKAEGNMWRLTVRGRNGATCDINEIALFVDKLTRRV